MQSDEKKIGAVDTIVHSLKVVSGDVLKIACKETLVMKLFQRGNSRINEVHFFLLRSSHIPFGNIHGNAVCGFADLIHKPKSFV